MPLPTVTDNVGPAHRSDGPPTDPAARPAAPGRRERGRATLAGVVAATLLGAVAAAVAMLWFAGIGAGTAGAQAAAPTPISIVDFGFDAQTTTIPAGTAVSFTNIGERPHTATDRGGTFDTQSINPGESASVTFDTPGTYFIFCRINPSKMNGVVVVQPAPAATAVRVQAVDPGNIEGETLRFDPKQIDVKAGTTLVFANVGGKPHSLTTTDGTYNTGIIQPGPEAGRFAGSSTTLKLDKPGTYQFFCEVHPQQMTGTLVVTGSPPASTATTAAAAPPPTSAATATTAPAAANLTIEDFAFTQKQVTVAPGAQLTFRNTGQAPHTATFDDVPLDTGTLEGGASATLKAPDKAGSYSYFCNIHRSMRGTLVVLAPGIADPAAGPVTTIAPGATGAGAAAATTVSAAAATTAPAGAATTAAAEVAAAAPRTSSGGTKTWVVITIAAACLLGGLGLAPFLSRRRSR